MAVEVRYMLSNEAQAAPRVRIMVIVQLSSSCGEIEATRVNTLL